MRRARVFLWAFLFLWAVAILSASAQAAAPTVFVLTVKGTVNPVLAGYIDRGIRAAEEGGGEAVVIKLDTPGGLDEAMRDIIQRFHDSKVPVIVWVAPAGARAASAGVFITMAAHVAAMAPNTAIGAAHPVTLGEQADATMMEKVTNDAVAYIKGIAELRGRNAEWAERAVRQSVSVSEQEALSLKVVDLLAPTLDSLLQQVDGRRVALLTGEVVLQTRMAAVENVNMSLLESFLFAISNPNVAYILLSLAMIGIFFELANPGSIFPGVIGGIFLLLALYALGTLPVNWVGVLLIGLAFLMFLAEIWVASHGALTVGGVASLLMGSLILLSRAPAFMNIDKRLIATVVVTVTAFFVFVVGSVVKAHRRRPASGSEGMVGSKAVARTPLNPEGYVFVEGERWQARSEGGNIEAEEEVIITRIEGLKLWVKKAVLPGKD